MPTRSPYNPLTDLSADLAHGLKLMADVADAQWLRLMADYAMAMALLRCRQRGVLLHVDACLGGFVLPFARHLGYQVPPFDFSVPGGCGGGGGCSAVSVVLRLECRHPAAVEHEVLCAAAAGAQQFVGVGNGTCDLKLT